MLFCFGAVMYSCNSTGKSKPDFKEGEVVIEPGATPVETTVIPVYAVWSPKTQNLIYDGLFDSASRFIRLCQTKEKLQIDDLSELTIRDDDDCYTQKSSPMIIISKDSSAPLFLTVLHVDSINKNVVGVTDNNDTIVTSIETMNPRSLQILKTKYQKASLKEEEVKKVETFYLPERAVENQEMKRRVMKDNAARYRRPN